jgi:C1A family cysteine protease
MRSNELTITRGDGTERKVMGYHFSADKLQNRKTYSTTKRFTKLPPKVDLRPHMTYIENQDQTNSCVANAVAGAYEYLVKKHTEWDYDVSRMFIYYNARDLGGIQGDNGSVIADAIEGLRQYGACAEESWPFELSEVDSQPSEEAYEEAAQFVVEDMQLVPMNLDAWKSCLAEGYPIVLDRKRVV